MKKSLGFRLVALLALAVGFSLAGCRSGKCPAGGTCCPAEAGKCCNTKHVKPMTCCAMDLKARSPLDWSAKMADSEIARRSGSNNLAWTEGGKARWDYTAGLFTLSLLKLNEAKPDAQYVDFTKQAIGTFLDAEGNIQGYTDAQGNVHAGYKLEDYNIDNIAAGKTVLALWLLTKEEKYQKCAAMLRKQLDTHPRTYDGGFWHKQRYTNQMWLDGLFMGAPFYAEYTKIFHGPASDFDDVVKQFQLINEHLYDPASGLYYHGWDSKKEQAWANPVTGTSSNFWGRAVGWYAMACVDVLDFLPAEHPGRAFIIGQIRQVADGVVKWQDADSGLWWQVMDKGGEPGNYREATASAMFVYTLAKAVNRGYLPREKYEAAALKGFEGISDKLIRTDEKGAINLTQCCSVAGLGSFNKPRDGSYGYYISEPIVENDLKGVGPFILAGIEVERMKVGK